MGELRVAQSTLEMKEAHIVNLDRQLSNQNSVLHSAESQTRQLEDYHQQVRLLCCNYKKNTHKKT